LSLHSHREERATLSPSHYGVQRRCDRAIRYCGCRYIPSRRQNMDTGTDFSAVCHEFTGALTEVLAENAVGPARRGRLARARAAVKKHPDYSEHAYFLAVETAFKNWEAMQNVGR